MCQPKPGPRCSAHARTRLAYRAAKRDQAQAEAKAARAAFSACGPADRDQRETLREAMLAADRAYWEAVSEHTQALREYETTPAGLRALRDALGRLGPEEADVAAEIQARLDQAQQARARQQADLRLSREHAARLAHPTEEEQAALTAATTAVVVAETALTAAEADLRHALEGFQSLGPAMTAADRAETAADDRVAAAETAATDALSNLRDQARRLYREAGVEDRYAGYYAADMEASACTHGNRSGYYTAGRFDTATVPRRVPPMKVKRSGPDRDKTLAARQAAEHDPQFQVARAELDRALNAVEAAREARTQTLTANTGVREQRQAAARACSAARNAHQDAQRAVETAREHHARLCAQIGSGLGAGPLLHERMDRVTDEIVRNPDGTINAYVYDGPSEGFPHGRYTRAVGVTTVHGMGPANALLLENGTRAWLGEHYARTVRGAGATRAGYPHVVLTSPQDGATPLRAENLPGAGFFTVLDSTD